MPMQTVSRPGVVVSRAFVKKLSEIVRPFSIAEYRQLALHYRSESMAGLPKAERESLTSAADRTVENGGAVYTDGRGSVTDSNKVIWSFPRGDAIPWDLFDDVRDGDFTLRAGRFSDFQARVVTSSSQTSITLTAPVEHLESAMPSVAALLDEYVDGEKLEASQPPFRVFIGHGGDRQWEAVRRVVANHYDYSAFESHDRLGQQAFEVVENMISEASVALIVMTATDERADGKKTARQNVVHELGFAQGRLGARKTIIVVEQGTELFTNIDSIQQIRFAPGEIHTVEDQVLAALANRKRELRFGSVG